MYADVLLLENFIINFFILMITSKLSKMKSKSINLIIGALVGALYIIVIFFPSLKMFFTLSMKIAVSVLMIIIAFTPEKFRDFFRVLSVFYIISFAFGGAAFFLFFITGKGLVINGVFYIKDYPLSMLITAFAFAYLLLTFCFGYIQDKLLNEKLIYEITISFKGRIINTNAILDTGNSLKEPISNFPVIVVEYDVLKDVLPESLSEVFKSSGAEINFDKLSNLPGDADWQVRIRLIPYSSLGKQNGMLIGIKPDIVKLKGKKFSREISDVIIGIYNSSISKDGKYRALLYPEILK